MYFHVHHSFDLINKTFHRSASSTKERSRGIVTQVAVSRWRTELGSENDATCPPDMTDRMLSPWKRPPSWFNFDLNQSHSICNIEEEKTSNRRRSVQTF